MEETEATFARLERLAEQKRWDELRRTVQALDPADLADLLEDLEPDRRDAVFELLDPETASDVLVELAPHCVDAVVGEMTASELADLAERMPPDEAVEFLSDLADDHGDQVLRAMAPEERDEIAGLLQHPEDSAGRIMTPEVHAEPPGATVREVCVSLGERELSDPVLYIYVVDPDGTLVGVATLMDLLKADPQERMGSIAGQDYVAAAISEDQEEVARKFHKYGLWVMPVVDEQGRLVGRITADDVLDVVREEGDEDLARMVGAPDIEEEVRHPVRIARMRLPWLLVTMTVGLLNSLVLKTMLNMTNNIVAIAVFVPAILAMGGNTGMQSSAVVIRGIALRQTLYSKLYRIVGREIRVGLILGLTCGLLTAFGVWGVLALSHADTGGVPLHVLAAAVGVAMGNAMVFASGFGSFVPVVLHRAGIDPALASGPFVTTSSDLSASLIYFATCALLLGSV